jgi:precorrin-2 dehydrogenase/sirohydrochlorin ferrochelatase
MARGSRIVQGHLRRSMVANMDDRSAPLNTFPVELDLRRRDVLVVGTGPEVAPKVERLVAAEAVVTWMLDHDGPEDAPAEVAALADRVTVVARRAVDADLAGRALVLTAPWTTDAEEARARRWYAAALAGGTLLCTVDRPETSTFVNAAVLRLPGVAMTFASGGRAPGVVRRIRDDLAAILGDPRFGRFVDRLGALRASLPRGGRAGPMTRAIEGFALEGRLRFPAWFERGDDP